MIVVEMKKHFQLRAIEWWSAGLMASWGFYTLLVPSMFLQNPSLEALLKFAPQHIWGLTAFSVGSIRLVSLMVNGFWYRTPSVRWLTSMVSVLVWFFITAALISSPITSPGVIVYGWLVLADIYSALRSASDYVEAAAQREIQKTQLAGTSNVSKLHRS